jgi:HK97 family phage portal protein
VIAPDFAGCNRWGVFERLRALFSAGDRRSDTLGASGSLSDPWTSQLLGGYGPTLSGVNVTGETAMRCAAVFGCVKVLAESISQLPVHVYRTMPDGSPERFTDHPAEVLLTEAANPWTSASEFRLILQTHLALFGNAFAFVNRVDGQITEVIQLDARQVGLLIDPITMVPTYQYNKGSEYARTFDRVDLLHIRGVGINLYQGVAPITAAAEAIGLALVMEQYAAGLFGNGARPSGVLKADKAMSESTVARLAVSFANFNRGGVNAGRTLVLEEGMQFQPLQLNSVDTQFIEMRKFAVMEIARIFRVPLHMLADLERVTFSNAEAMGQQFLSFAILPILRQWTDALRMTLLTPAERKAGVYIDFTVDDLARADLLARFTAYSQAINAGILNPNEIRSMENRGPYDGGDTFTRPVNTAPVDGGKVAMPIAEQPTTPNAGPIQPEANL